MEFQTVSVKNAADVHTGVVWYIDGPDRQYVIEAFASGTTFRSRDVISSIITSIRFSP